MTTISRVIPRHRQQVAGTVAGEVAHWKRQTSVVRAPALNRQGGRHGGRRSMREIIPTNKVESR